MENSGLYKFFDWLLNRKILVTVINLFLVTAGILSYLWLEWRQEPTSNQSTITISTKGKFGSHIDNFENEVTKKIEDVVSNISGIDYFTSSTKNGESDVTVHFKDTVEPQEALNRIRTAVGSVANNLPSYANFPQISSGDANDKGVLDILFYSNDKENSKEKILAIAKYVEEDLKPRILQVDGVAGVKINGVENPQIYIQLDLNKIHRLKMNPAEIQSIINKGLKFTQSTDFGGIATKSKKINITSMGTAYSIEDIKKMTILPGLILSDIASVKVKQQTPTIYFNGSNSAIYLSIFKSSNGNPIATINEVTKVIKKEINQRKDIQVNFLNRLKKTKELFKKVKQTGIEAILLVLLIVLLFTFSLAGSLVPAIAVPVSITGTFVVMLALKLSFNPATLAALVLSIGLVVDDAIVILENIHKKIMAGIAPLKAAIEATAELCLPIILMTLTLAFVFLPTLFGEGPTRYELKEFAIVIASSVIFSGINSLTLSPILSYLFMANHKENHTHKKVMKSIDDGYKWLLTKAFQWKKTILAIVGFLLVLIIALSQRIPGENKPYIVTEDVWLSGTILRQQNSVNKKYFYPYIQKIGNILSKYKGLYYKFFYISIENGRLSIRIMLFKKIIHRKKQILDDLTKELSEAVPGNMFNLSSDSLEKKVSFNMVGEKTSEELDAITENITKTLKQEGLIKSVWTENQKSDNYNFSLNFNKIQELNIDPARVKELLPILFHNTTLGDASFVKSPKNYPSWIGVHKDFKYDPEKILSMSFGFEDVRDRRKITYVALKDLIAVSSVRTSTNKRRFMAYPSTQYTYELPKEVTVGMVVNRIEQLKFYLPFGTRIEFTDDARDYLNSRGNLLKMIIFAILCIFFILAAQFESLMDGFLILMTAPLAFMGAVTVMKMFSLTFNVYTIIGLITLVGLITKHGILFVSTANELVEQGIQRKTAIIEGAVSRLNPVIMTSLAMVLGCLPLAISQSTAVAPLKQMSLIIIGGVILGTFMTLIVIPLLYYYLSRRGRKLQPLDKNNGNIGIVD
jgi:multidrug efflux pump